MTDMTPVVDAFAGLFIFGCAAATTSILLVRAWLRSREYGEVDDDDE